jgi:large subunit ribosomal protein L23
MSPKKAPKKASSAETAAAEPAAKEATHKRMAREQLMNVLLAPHMSEKSARVSANGNQYVFRVRNEATRTDVKDAVELMFEVKVDSVQVLNAPGKMRRFGRLQGARSGFKKAYVRLAAGQTIDFAGEAAK